METTTKGRLYQLHSWVARPTSVQSLRTILKKMSDADLLELMKNVMSKTALTIAWAEYGRRHAEVKIDFEIANQVLEVRARDLVIGHGASFVC